MDHLYKTENNDPKYCGMKDAVRKYIEVCRKTNGIRLSIGLCDEGVNYFYITPEYLDGAIMDDECLSDDYKCPKFSQARDSILHTLKESYCEDFRFAITKDETRGMNLTPNKFSDISSSLSLPFEIFVVTVIPKKPYPLTSQLYSEFGL